MPTTTITFNGLLVFRPDPANDLCEVGVLRAREAPHSHILQIDVTPNPQTGSGTFRINPDLLESHVLNGHTRWILDVALNGQPLRGLVLNTAIPADRKNPTAQNNDDFGWIINIESGEFHAGRLDRTRDRLKPVISLSKGRLFTSCKTDSIDVNQGPHTRSDFGFIAGAISLAVDTSQGEMPVLYFVDQQGNPTEIFSLPDTAHTSYFISIRNTPLAGAAGGHFHLFYDRLFHTVGPNQRFSIPRHFPPRLPPSGRCPEGQDPEPDPFKCGGVSVGPGSGPLG